MSGFLRAFQDLGWRSNVQVQRFRPSARLTKLASQFCAAIIQKRRLFQMSKKSKKKVSGQTQLTFLPEDSPAKIYQWPDFAKAWLASGQGYGSSLYELLATIGQDGLSSKMFPVFYPATAEETLPSSFAGWSNAGMACAGGFLTLNMTEWHSGARVCSLSQVLEPQVAPKFFLSATAARGILRRAGKRGKMLPELLARALRQVADSEPILNAPADCKPSASPETVITLSDQQHSEPKAATAAVVASI